MRPPGALPLSRSYRGRARAVRGATRLVDGDHGEPVGRALGQSGHGAGQDSCLADDARAVADLDSRARNACRLMPRTASATARCWQPAGVPKSPFQAGSLGSQAMSPTAAMVTVVSAADAAEAELRRCQRYCEHWRPTASSSSVFPFGPPQSWRQAPRNGVTCPLSQT